MRPRSPETRAWPPGTGNSRAAGGPSRPKQPPRNSSSPTYKRPGAGGTRSPSPPAGSPSPPTWNYVVGTRGMPIEPLVPHPSERFGAATRHLPHPPPSLRRLARTSPTARLNPDAVLTALGLTLETADQPIPGSLKRLEREASARRAELDELASLRLPADERDGESPGLAWPEQDRRQRDAVLQPPHHEIDPSADVLSAYRDTRNSASHAEPEMEAGA